LSEKFPAAVSGCQWRFPAISGGGRRRSMGLAVTVQGGGQWRKDKEKKVATIKAVQKNNCSNECCPEK